MDYDRRNEWDGLLTKGNKIKHEQWSVNWRKWDETWTMNCGLKESRWYTNNEVDNDRKLRKETETSFERSINKHQKDHHWAHYFAIFLSVLEGCIKGYDLCETHITI